MWTCPSSRAEREDMFLQLDPFTFSIERAGGGGVSCSVVLDRQSCCQSLDRYNVASILNRERCTKVHNLNIVRTLRKTYCHQAACYCYGSQNFQTFAESKQTYLLLFYCTKLRAATPHFEVQHNLAFNSYSRPIFQVASFCIVCDC